MEWFFYKADDAIPFQVGKIRVARDFLSWQSDMNCSRTKDTRNSGILLVKNASGEDRPVLKYSELPKSIQYWANIP